MCASSPRPQSRPASEPTGKWAARPMQLHPDYSLGHPGICEEGSPRSRLGHPGRTLRYRTGRNST
eukprot:scaffold2254_cov393-Prasinococcus_capsulatus_cf.AAC.17